MASVVAVTQGCIFADGFEGQLALEQGLSVTLLNETTLASGLIR